MPTLAMDSHGQPRSWGDGATWDNHLAYADGLLLTSKSRPEVQDVCNALKAGQSRRASCEI